MLAGGVLIEFEQPSPSAQASVQRSLARKADFPDFPLPIEAGGCRECSNKLLLSTRHGKAATSLVVDMRAPSTRGRQGGRQIWVGAREVGVGE
jgi:hypothetical protein